MASCNHVPLELKEKFCPVCGQPTTYFSPIISTLEVSDPKYEYMEQHSAQIHKLNGLASRGWRVVAATYVADQAGIGASGWSVLLERPRGFAALEGEE